MDTTQLKERALNALHQKFIDVLLFELMAQGVLVDDHLATATALSEKLIWEVDQELSKPHKL